MSSLRAVTDVTFADEVVASSKPVLVDFWAPWCGPCRQVAPILEAIAAEHSASMEFRALNIDENPVTPASYRVTGVPTLAVFERGQVVKLIVGAKPKAALLRDLADYLS